MKAKKQNILLKMFSPQCCNSNLFKCKALSRVRLFVTPWAIYSPWNSPDQNTGVGSLSLLQGIFSTQESNWHLLHCRLILYQLSYEGTSSKIHLKAEKL